MYDEKTEEILKVAREKMIANIYDCHDPKNNKNNTVPLKRLVGRGIYKENGK